MELNRVPYKIPKFLVVGHRGNGMNVLTSMDQRMKAIKENSIMSFDSAAKFPIDFIEFDVQVSSCFPTLVNLVHQYFLFHIKTGTGF